MMHKNINHIHYKNLNLSSGTHFIQQQKFVQFGKEHKWRILCYIFYEFEQVVYEEIYFNKKFMNGTQKTKTNHNSSLLELKEFVHYSVS